jgi:polysaccharide biosynthesis transport protein
MNQIHDPANAISLADVFKNTLRHPLRILACTGLGLVAGLGLVSLVKPVYQTEAKVLIERREAALNSDGSTSQDSVQPIDERLIASQVSVMKSADFVSRLVNDLGLDKDETFTPEKVSYGAAKSLLVRFGFSDDRRALSRERRATDSVQDSLTVFSEPNSNVITVRAETGNPEQAARIANSLAEKYISSTSAGEGTDAKRVQAWLAAQIAELRSKVSASEAEAERFRSDAGLLKGTNATLGVQEISDLRSQLTVAESAQSEAEARAREIKSLLARRGSVDTSAEVLNSPVIQNLQQQRIEANRQLKELSAIYLPKNPKYKAAKQQVDEIDKQIRAEAIRIVEGLDSQAKIAASRANAVRTNLDKMKQRESTANLEDVKLKALEREATANRQLLETLLARYVEVNTRKDFDVRPTLARIIQTAQVPNAVSFPRVGPTILLTTLAGLGLGLGLSFLAAIMRMSSASAQASGRINEYRPQYEMPPRYAEPTPPPAQQKPAPVQPAASVAPVAPAPAQRTPEPVIQQPLPPVPPPEQTVAETFSDRPFMTGLESLIQPHHPDSDRVIGVGTEELTLSGNLMALNNGSGARNFAFTRVGCEPIESATAVYVCSKDLAAARNRVLVIDLDHERAELERLFMLPEGHGLLDLLAGQSDFSKLIARDSKSGVHIIRLGDISNAKQPQLLSEQIRSVLRSIQGIYDFVLLHVGKATADCLPFMLTCDVAVIVAPPSHDDEVVKAIQTLTEKGPVQVLHVTVDRRTEPLPELAVAS